MLWLKIARKEFKEIFRSPVMIMLSYFVPLVFFFVFSYGINLDVENIPLAIVDLDRSQKSLSFSEKLYTHKYFTLLGYMDLKNALHLIKLNQLRAVVIIPPDFEKQLNKERTVSVQMLIDGSYPYRADIIRGYLKGITGKFNEELVRRWLDKRGIKRELNLVSIDARVMYNQSIESYISIVPGVIVIIFMMNPAILASLAIAREKDFGTIANIYTSDISRLSFITGKAIPYWVISYTGFLVILALSFAVFKLPFRGNFILYLIAGGIFILCSTLIGILISIFSKNMIAAQIIAMVVSVVPAFLYSGFLMPVSSLGKSSQIEAKLFPSVYFMNITKGAFLKGFGIKEMYPDIITLIIYALIMLCLCTIFFKKAER